MTTRRNFRRAGRFAWRNRSTIMKAATTLMSLRPIISTGNMVANQYFVHDFTSVLETTLGREALSPTYIRARGLVDVRNTDTAFQSGTFGMGFFMGPAAMDFDDFPDLRDDPDRFMWAETHHVDLLPKAATVTGIDDSGRATYEASGIFRPRFAFSRRARPGDHLFFLAISSLSSVQASGEVTVLTRLRG